MDVAWGELLPGAAGGLTVAGVVWRGFRTLSRKLDHVDRIPFLEREVRGLRHDLTAHMAEEEEHLAAERNERKARQEHMDGRLGRIEDRVTAIAQGTP